MKAFVQPKMISWARSRADFSVEDVAKKLHVKVEKITAWECGKGAPTLCQARNLAKAMHIPLGWLFLKTPPEEKVALPDLRTVRDGERAGLSVDFRDQLNEVLYKQQEYAELILEEGAEPLPFVGKFSIRDEVDTVAEDIRAVLGVTHDMRQQAKGWEDFLRTVMRSGVVAGNPHRPLSVEEFRGFAVSDVYAPLIFINGKDAPPAQIFTLAHELAHLWVGESGISNLAMNRGGGAAQRIEAFCNKVAAELLVPAAEMSRLWSRQREPQENIQVLVCHFRVSGAVVLYRAKNMRFIEQDVFEELYRIEIERYRKQKKDGGGGPPPTLTIPARNSLLLTDTVLAAAYEGRVLFRDACRILGTTMSTLNKLAFKSGVA
jgi:Zn-dependent peptidase ImmA (M78 family)/DNA-binding XRE family transcriptional regulator